MGYIYICTYIYLRLHGYFSVYRQCSLNWFSFNDQISRAIEYFSFVCNGKITALLFSFFLVTSKTVSLTDL